MTKCQSLKMKGCDILSSNHTTLILNPLCSLDLTLTRNYPGNLLNVMISRDSDSFCPELQWKVKRAFYEPT